MKSRFSHNSSQPGWGFPSKSLSSWQKVERLQPKASYPNGFRIVKRHADGWERQIMPDIPLSLMDRNDFLIATSALSKQAAVADVYFYSKAYFF